MSRLGFASPGVGVQLSTQTNQFIWGGSRQELLVKDFQIDSSARDSGSNNTQVLRPGMMLGRITSSGKLKEFDLASSDGSQILTGFLQEEMPLINGLGVALDGFAPVYVRAPVKAKNILYKGVTIIGHASESAIRDQIRRRFQLDDEYDTVPSSLAPSKLQYASFNITTAQLNAGIDLLPAVPGLKYRITDFTMIANGGNATTATGVLLTGVQGASTVNLASVAIAALTRSAVVKPNTANVTVLTDGASFDQNDVNTKIALANNGSAMTVMTSLDVFLTYELAP